MPEGNANGKMCNIKGSILALLVNPSLYDSLLLSYSPSIEISLLMCNKVSFIPLLLVTSVLAATNSLVPATSVDKDKVRVSFQFAQVEITKLWSYACSHHQVVCNLQ